MTSPDDVQALIVKLELVRRERFFDEAVITDARNALTAALGEIGELREGLRFYAWEWEQHVDPEGSGLTKQPTYNLICDEGDKARALLEQPGG